MTDLQKILLDYLATPSPLTIARIEVARLAHELIAAINVATDDERHAAKRAADRARHDQERWDHCD